MQGLTPAVFWANRERLLAFDRDELEGGLETVRHEQSLVKQMGHLTSQDAEDRAESPGAAADTRYTGVPNPESRLAVDLGPPVVDVGPWRLPAGSSRRTTVWVTEIQKPALYPERVYRYPPLAIGTGQHEGDQHIGLALPSPKSDSWAYKAAMSKLLDTLGGLDESTSLVLKPATKAHLDLLASVLAAPENDVGTHIGSRLDTLPCSSLDIVSSRKMLIPIILLLLCSFPDLSASSGAGSAQTARLDKTRISDVLLLIVALWPDGNPHRAALKRVNEILLAGDRS